MSNRIRNIAIVGAGGNVGSYMTASLLATGNFNLTALTRADSATKLPTGVASKAISYSDPSTIVAALQGQDALVITLATSVPQDTQGKLIRAAAEAGVPWVLPNEFTPDPTHPGFMEDFAPAVYMNSMRDLISDLGRSSFIAVHTGFWYEWSVAIPPAYGIDVDRKEVLFFDDGAAKINTSTWPQVGRAVAALLSLPVKSEGGDQKRSLENFRNGHVWVSSFLVSQQDMFESVLRVTGGKKEEWKISSVPSKERWTRGRDDMNAGDQMGFLKTLYTRIFYPDGAGNFQARHDLDNEMLGLPKEDLDSATKDGVERGKTHPFPVGVQA